VIKVATSIVNGSVDANLSAGVKAAAGTTARTIRSIEPG